jgi:phosphoglucosamine mutase
VISASHNPYDDNGIKFFSGTGSKLPDAAESAIERELARPLKCMTSAKLGKARRIEDAAARYIEFCKSTFPSHLDLRGMRIVVDCAHGAAYHIAPHVYHELGADVEAVGASPDGFNINAGVGATAPQALQEAVKRARADLGVALDGDGDRLAMVDASGRLYDGDQLIYLIAHHRKRTGDLGKGVVGTQMSNLALEQALGKLKIEFARAKVGDRYVLEMLASRGWQLGGENSGHILCLDKHTTGDGIISSLQVLRALVEDRTTLARAAGALTLFPQILINVAVKRRDGIVERSEVKRALAEAQADLDGSGRVLLRPSGTELVIRVMVEGRNPARIEHWARRIADVVRSAA